VAPDPQPRWRNRKLTNTREGRVLKFGQDRKTKRRILTTQFRGFGMPYKFLRGDTVRRIGKPDDFKVASAEDDGGRYLLTQNIDNVVIQNWASEDELALVKRASDDE
jgi:hypothetical protein